VNTRTRLWLIAGLSLLALIVIGLVLQAINTLYFQLSWVLPAWIVQPIFFLVFAGLVVLLVQLAWPWIQGRLGGKAQRIFTPTTRESPRGRRPEPSRHRPDPRPGARCGGA
jgi:hypothetical protein